MYPVMMIPAMFVADADTADFRDDFMAACKMHHYSDEQIADLLGIGRAQFADQKALRQHLSMWRVKRLPLRVQVDFWKLHGKRLGLTVLDDSDLGEYLRLRVARFKTRQQLKMRLAIEQVRESA